MTYNVFGGTLSLTQSTIPELSTVSYNRLGLPPNLVYSAVVLYCIS